MHYDFIGDIHGHADKLEALLRRLGYTAQGRGYRAPAGRQAVFLGDLIDRGPQQLRVLEIVRSMVDAGHALCLMGNHEFNAIAFVTPDPRSPGGCLRPNRIDGPKARKNRAQHAAFLREVGEGSARHRAWVDWLRTLPPYLDLGGVRAVHASWHEPSIATLRAAGWVPGVALDEGLVQALHAHTDDGAEAPATQARKRLTCGLEIALPPDRAIEKDGHRFDTLRIADWRHGARQLHEVALLPPDQHHVLQGLGELSAADLDLLRHEGAPVFFGHHWMRGTPVLESDRVACLDWSAGAGGPLAAYRWQGEATLTAAHLVWVDG